MPRQREREAGRRIARAMNTLSVARALARPAKEAHDRPMQKHATTPLIRSERADDGRTTMLLTGFGPFPRVPVNATMTLVPRLAAAARRLFPATRIIDDILPTEWVAAPALVDALIARNRPDIILHFGVSSRARGFEIEARGRNARAWAADASGAHPSSTLVRPEGNAVLPSRLRVDEIVRRVRMQHVPTYRSWSAGSYLCNATLYHSLVESRGHVPIVGFVHIPDALAPAGPRAGRTIGLRTAPGSPMSWHQALTGGIEIVAALLDQPSPHPGRRALALQRHL